MKNPSYKKEFLEKLRTGHNIQSACKAVNLSRQSVYRWMKENEKFRSVVEKAQGDGDDYMNDYVENKAIKLIQKDNLKMLMFYLEKRHPKFANPNNLRGKLILLAEEVRKLKFDLELKENTHTIEIPRSVRRRILKSKIEDFQKEIERIDKQLEEDRKKIGSTSLPANFEYIRK